MAILRGFPPSNTISPGVRIAEKDLSFVAPDQSFHRAGLVGFASKGPLNVPTLVGSTSELHRVFGNPHPQNGDPYLIYAAEQYLTSATELYVVRVGDTDSVSDEAAATAFVEVPVAGGSVVVSAADSGPYHMGKIDPETGSYLLENGSTTQTPANAEPTDYFFRWAINGITSSKTLVVPGINSKTSDNTYTTDDLVDELNSQLDDLFDGIEFSNKNNKLAVSTTFAYGPQASLELIAVQDSLYGENSPVGLGGGMTKAQSTNTTDRYPDDTYHTQGNYDFTGLSDLELQIVVDGTDNVLIDNVVQSISIPSSSKTSAQLATLINAAVNNGDIPGGFYALADNPTSGKLTIKTKHYGAGARLLVKTASAGSLLGFDGVTAEGESPAGVTGDGDIADLGIVTGDTGSEDVSFVLKADSAGIEGNGTQVVIQNDLRENVFTLEVYNNGVQVEAWGNLTKNQSSRYYIGTFLSLVSDYIIVEDNTDELAPPKDGTYVLVSGSDGIPSDPDRQDALLVGSDAASTGLYALSEPEQIDIDLVAVPGHPSTTVVTALIDLAQNKRSDCLAIIDPPFGLGVNEITNWQNGTHPLNSERFDTDFAALYWPWVKITDSYNGIDVWVPPSGSVMAAYARSDSISAPWFAPAGLTRGLVSGIGDVFSRPTIDERDLMYGNRNAINPIVQFPDVGGFVIWGQKTLQRLPTALDRVNVRRMMFAIQKRIRVASRTLLFDPHDSQFTDKFIQIATRILQDVQLGRGLHDFIINADDTLNTSDVIDRNEFRAEIGVQPTRAVEFIFVEFSLHRTGDFTSSADNF